MAGGPKWEDAWLPQAWHAFVLECIFCPYLDAATRLCLQDLYFLAFACRRHVEILSFQAETCDFS